ncbi:MAG TPA: S-layer homology domain-containing protein [Candidatus Omnitrophota bacterium]|nr:S-layer homology domain-containing protein [Candidatus Omnitrophota bacterium]
MKNYLFAGLAIVLALSSICLADGTKVANDPTRISVGARVLGMGKSFVGMSDDISSIFINPAGIASVGNAELTSMSGKFINEVNYLNVGGALPTGLGVFGIGYTSSDIAFTSPSATTEVLDGVRIIPSSTEGSTYSYKNSALLLSFGAPLQSLPFDLIKNASIGGTMKLYVQNLGGAGINGGNASGFDMDLGIKYPLHPAIGLGAVVQNVVPYSMGGKIHWDSGVDESLPSVLKLGISARLMGETGLIKFKDNELTLNIDGDFTPLRPNIPSLIHTGLEWSPVGLIALRAGIDQDVVGTGSGGLDVANNLTLGVGVILKEFRFDYAFHQYYSIPENDTNYFSLSYGILNEKPKPAVIRYLGDTDPADKTVVSADKLRLSGRVLRPEVKQVSVAGYVVNVSDGSYEAEIPVFLGKNSIEIKALDETGNLLESRRVRILRLTSFSDVAGNYWAADPIGRLATLGIVSGYADQSYKPEKPVNRAEMITLLVRVSGVTTEGASKKLPFKDVSQKFWAAPFVATGVKLGFMTGYPDRTFKPVRSINRAEGVTTIARFSGIDVAKPVTEARFSDLPGRHWAAKAVYAASNAGMLNYITTGRFEPGRALSRGEVAEIISKSDIVSQKVADLMDWEKGY